MNGLYRVKIRRGGRWPGRDNAGLVDGGVYRFRFGWMLTHECDGRYALEAAMVPVRDDDPTHPYPELAPPWLAMGDLERTDEPAHGDLVEQAR